ncbi:hypothetical protein BJX65DRAFT_295181 [Aspergillus insuetus]
MPDQGPEQDRHGPSGYISRGIRRSRKGCPECRKRKIKCDEQQPSCGECVRMGRVCHILDSMFITTSYSPLARVSRHMQSKSRRSERPRREIGSPRNRSTGSDNANLSDGVNPSPRQARATHLRAQHRPEITVTAASDIPQDSLYTDTAEPVDLDRRQTYEDQPTPGDESGVDVLGPPPNTLAAGPSEDSPREQGEIAFFLRYFSEGPGQFLDVCRDPLPYFSQHVTAIAQTSALVRYSACALAAKQLGHIKAPESRLRSRQTSCQALMLRLFADSHLDFLWYGAKYYEKALRLLTAQLSQRDCSACHHHLSPSSIIYQTGPSPQSDSDIDHHHDAANRPFQILATCMLAQYEDLSATSRAWTANMDGIFKLLLPHLSNPSLFQTAICIPHPMEGLNSAFWYFALNDVLGAFIFQNPTRLAAENLYIWRTMGLPLDNSGQLLFGFAESVPSDGIMLKLLIRMLALVVNMKLDMGLQQDPNLNLNSWTRLSNDLGQWHAMLPPTFSAPVSWPPNSNSDPAFIITHILRETWFSSATSAIAMALYHMTRILLLIHQPREMFFQQKQAGVDLLLASTALWDKIRQHALEIIPIARAMPSDTVRKYLVQPLYVAGRSLVDPGERDELIAILSCIDAEVGVFTCYRIRDLAEEWNIPYELPARNEDGSAGSIL